MDIGAILTKEFISLFGFLILFVFVITNKKIERSDKCLFFGVILAGLIEIIVFEVESYLGTLPSPTFWRVLLSAIGYLLRPALVVLIILLVDKSLRTKKKIALLLIPLAICFLCVSTAFFSHLCFWYNDTNNFQRGLLGYVPHIVCVLYTFICLVVACRLIKKRDKLYVLVLICASLCPVFAICLDMFVEDTGLSRISIMFCSLIMYIQNHSIALNNMIDDIPGAIAEFRVKNNSIKIISFNDLMCQMFGLSYIEFKSITRDDPFAFLDEQSNDIFKASIEIAMKQHEYSFRFKTMLLGKEKHFNTSLKVSKHREDVIEIYATIIDVTAEALVVEELGIRNDEISLMMNQLGKIICVYDIPTRTLSMSDKYAELRGFKSNKAVVPDETNKRHLISKEFVEAYNNFYERIFAGEHSGNIICKFVDSKGDERWEKTDFVIVATKDDKPLRAIISIEDIITTYQEKLLLEKYKSTIDSLMGDKKYCLLIDLSERKVLAYEGGLLPQNAGFNNQTLEEIVEYFIARNIKNEDKDTVRELYDFDKMLVSYKAGVMRRHIEIIVKMTDDSEHWFRLSFNLDSSKENKIMATLLCEDIDDEYRKYNVLKARANYDYLTGVFIREATMEGIEKYLLEEGKNGTHALVMIDMDNLKAVNDNLGHQYGDDALKNFTDKVKESIKSDDIIGRIGGDEFFVLIKNITSTKLEFQMKTLIHNLERTYTNNDKSIKVTASAGISIYCGNDKKPKNLKEMYSQADFALYKSKVNGKNRCTFWTSQQKVDNNGN